MKKNNYRIILLLIVTASFMSCDKSSSYGYPDPDDPAIAIFSNTGNNILTCYKDGMPWRTSDRRDPILSGPQYEVIVRKIVSTGATDTLEISWSGNLVAVNTFLESLVLHMAMPKNFSYKNFSAFNAQRISINSSNGYFTDNTHLFNNNKGTGTIYFNIARLDSVGIGQYAGKMAGLLEANLPAFKITKGRFDHILDPYQVNF